MKNSLSVWQLAGVTFTAILGTILHFLYEWTEKNSFVALFAAVNESTWEHMKLFFFPALLFAIVQGIFFYEEYKSFWWIKLIGIVSGLLLIPVLFYTTNGAFGKTPDWLNILFFFVSVGVAYLIEYILLQQDFAFDKFPALPIALLSLIAFCFFVFTFLPPKLPVFQDPITGEYGIYQIK